MAPYTTRPYLEYVHNHVEGVALSVGVVELGEVDVAHLYSFVLPIEHG